MNHLNLIFNLLKLANSIQKATSGLPASRMEVLYLLQSEGPMNLSQLAKIRGVRNSSMSVLMDQMIKDKLVIRGRSKSDRRQHIFLPSRQAMHLFQSDTHTSWDRLNRIMNELDKDERDQLNELLSRLISEFDAL